MKESPVPAEEDEAGRTGPAHRTTRRHFPILMTTRPRIYLAGPDVFRPDAAQHYALLTAACEKHGLAALSPFDTSITNSTSPHEIYAQNMEMLRTADGVVANLAPFRGEEPDSGTVFEVGVAAALGVAVVGYGTQKLAPGAGAVTLAESAEDAIRAMAAILSGETERHL